MLTSRREVLAQIVAVADLATQPQPVEVARAPTFTEGPAFDQARNLYFSHREGIYQLRPDGQLREWTRDPAAGFHGHRVEAGGTHLVCVTKKSAVWRLGAEGGLLEVASSSCEGKDLSEPNDIALDRGRSGGFYFTDPGGSRTEPVGSVYYTNRGGVTKMVADSMRVPNGIVVDPASKFLYVAETGLNRIVRFGILGRERWGPLEVFATLPSREGHQAAPDGLAMDEADRLYVAHLGTGTVLVLDAKGRIASKLPGGNYDVSNLAFGGPNRSHLYVTGSVGHRRNTEGRVYRLVLPGVRGLTG
jgi:gluconolactonase